MKLETHTGLYIDYDKPSSQEVDIRDIARALAMTCRFGGHTLRFLSIAEHAMLVAQLVEARATDAGAGTDEVRFLTLAALHHDSHEAYTGDIPSPLKTYMGDEFRRLVSRLDLAIGIKVGVSPAAFSSELVKWADALALRIEAAHVKTSRGVGDYWGQTGLPVEVMEWHPQFMDPANAERCFLERHEALTR